MLELGLGLVIFLAKAVIVVVALIIVLSFVASLALKQKMNEEKFELTNLSKELKKSTLKLKSRLLSGKDQKKIKKEAKAEKKKTPSLEKRAFVLDFNGDVKASSTEKFKECITQVIALADPKKRSSCCTPRKPRRNGIRVRFGRI